MSNGFTTDDIERFRSKLRQARTVEELDDLKQDFPVVSEEQKREAIRHLDDGIYDENGNLVGERHPED